MATTRLDIRLNEAVKVKAEKASALLGKKSLTDYIVTLMDEDATRIIAQYETMTVENDIFDRFVLACEQAEAPNKALREAVAFTQEQGMK